VDQTQQVSQVLYLTSTRKEGRSASGSYVFNNMTEKINYISNAAAFSIPENRNPQSHLQTSTEYVCVRVCVRVCKYIHNVTV